MMFTYQIKFSILVHDDKIADKIMEYLSFMFKAGLITKDYIVLEENGGYTALMTFVNTQAMNEKYLNKHIKNSLENLEKYCKISMQTKPIGRNIDCEDYCKCNNPSYFMLLTDIDCTDWPVRCGDCGKVYPIYQIPYPYDRYDHSDLYMWQRAHESMDFLWHHSLHDRFTVRQLRSPVSQLSIEGRALCTEFEKKTGVPFYYYLFYPKFKEAVCCPLCGEKWESVEVIHYVVYKCDKCRIIAGTKFY